MLLTVRDRGLLAVGLDQQKDPNDHCGDHDGNQGTGE
jgi:hypothetical protein